MTHSSMTDAIGRVAELRTDGLRVFVEIVDAKESYGRRRYLVAPTEGNGSGEAWVDADRISFVPDLFGAHHYERFGQPRHRALTTWKEDEACLMIGGSC